MHWVNDSGNFWNGHANGAPVRQRVELPQRDEPPGGSDSPSGSPWPCPRFHRLSGERLPKPWALWLLLSKRLIKLSSFYLQG